MERRYIKDITRINCSLFDVKAWYLGELRELRKSIGFGFTNTIFVSENGVVSVYYDVGECDEFYKILESVLDEDFFDELCDDFNFIIDVFKPKTEEDVFRFLVGVWPAFVVFEELSNYPELGNGNMIRRLFRVRENTESYSYELKKIVRTDHLPKNYIFYKGQVFYTSFLDFVNENRIVIENGQRNTNQNNL